ncbi:MAG: hypothetical protein CW742_12250 [Methanoregula sp.]|nr:MAG: hypothetical protein CW742_12250 [Methanoregula sp.]
MGADFTASIRYTPDAKAPKPAYSIACRQLGISESGSGDLEEMVQEEHDCPDCCGCGCCRGHH